MNYVHHPNAAQGNSLTTHRQLDYSSKKLISVSEAPTVLFQRMVPMHLTSHTFITSFLRQFCSSVYYLLIVPCAHGRIALHLLVIYQYSLNTDRLLFSPSAMGNTNNDLPTGLLAALRICLNSEPRDFMRDQKALCKVMLHLLVGNK